jgi:hypothetical protein
MEFNPMKFTRYIINYGDGKGDMEVIKYENKRWTRPYDQNIIVPVSPLQKEGEPPLPMILEGWQMGVTPEQIWDYVKDVVTKS